MIVLGLDIGGTKCAAVFANVDENKIQIFKRYVLPTMEHYNDVIEILLQWADTVCKELNLRIDRVGISCGGPLSIDRRYILSPPNLKGWDNVPIVDMVQKHFEGKVLVKMENDADACAMAEFYYGAGRGSQNMIFLTFGTGLGAGLVLGGRLYRGGCGMAGEIGHIRIAKDGPIGYGKIGSLEGYASGGGIKQLAEQYGFIPEENGQISAKAVIEAAYKGDGLAKRILEISARRLGQGLAILIDILNPDIIILGSIFVRAEELLRPYIEDEIQKECLEPSAQMVKIVPAELSEQIGDYGAICVAL